jgi:hypothetical protein
MEVRQVQEVTPQQAQELADVFDELAKERADDARDSHENIYHGDYGHRSTAEAVKARLAKLLESVHAG